MMNFKIRDLAQSVHLLAAVMLMVPTMIGYEGQARYIVYLAPFVLLCGEWYRNKKMEWAVDGVIPFLICACILCVFCVYPINAGWKYVALIMLMLCPVLFKIKFSDDVLTILFSVMVACQCYVTFSEGFKVVNLELFSGTDRNQTHTLPFIFGLCLGPFIMAKRYRMAALCILMLVMAGKRVPIFGGIISLACIFFYTALGRLGKNLKVLIYNYLIPFSFMFFTLYLNDILRIVATAFRVNENIFTSGRLIGQILAYQWIENSTFSDLILGQGLGFADGLARGAWGIEGVLVHSDYLRIMLDIGVLFGCLFIYFYLRLVGRGPYGTYIIPYICVLWLSDNTIIYPFFGLGVVLVALSSPAEGAAGNSSLSRRGLGERMRSVDRSGRGG